MSDSPRKGRPATSARARRSRRSPLLTVAVFLLSAALIASGAALLTAGSHDARDLEGHPVTLEADASPPPDVVKRMDADDDTGSRFRVPSAGLDVPLGALNAVDGSITPPGFTSAYTVRNIGVAPSEADEGTVYVVMHSLRGGGVGPGNALIDVDERTARVAPGTSVTVDGRSYTVTGDLTVTKSGIRSADDIWRDAPGRLVIITCLQRPEGGPSQDNVVITAQLDH